MAFVCTLTGDGFNVDVAQRGSSRIVIARIGVDDENDTIYSVLVGLDVGGGGLIELVFCILAASSGGDEEPTEYWSGTETASFIRGDDRVAVLNTILTCVGELVRSVQPPHIYMNTIDTHIPERALLKHILIARVVEECGYDVKMPDAFHGQYNWYMERRT